MIGPNASGKTNFIEFFKILSDIFKGKEEPFREFGGYRKIVTNHETNRNLMFYIEYETTINGETYNCRYELSFRTNNGFDVYIIKERFEIPELDINIYQRPIENIKYIPLPQTYRPSKNVIKVNIFTGKPENYQKIEKALSNLYFLFSNSVFLFNIDFFGIRNSFYPFLLKKEKELDPYARNLFNILANIYFKNQALLSNIEYVLNHYFKIKKTCF